MSRPSPVPPARPASSGWRRFASFVLPLGLTLGIAVPALAQQFNLDLGEGGSTTGRLVQLVLLMTVLSLAPSILVMMTSFTRIVVVLGFIRNAMGTQTNPPNTVVMSLALFLTAFVMAPTFELCYEQGIRPLMDNKIDEIEAFDRTVKPLHTFMMRQVREQDLKLFLDIARVPEQVKPEEAPLKAVIPAFMISELRRGFEIGFLVYLPFLIIDMVIASVLMSMGMMMLSPQTISMPFKLIFFVLVDGWYLVCGSLVQSFGPQ